MQPRYTEISPAEFIVAPIGSDSKLLPASLAQAEGLVAGIQFVATSALYYTGVGAPERAEPGLSYGVELSPGESVELATGENFRKLDGRLSLRTSPGVPLLHDKQVGTLHYFEGHADPYEPIEPGYIIEVTVSAQQLNDLLAAARVGRIPSQIIVRAENMQYDWQPDGSGKKWDNKTDGVLAVTTAIIRVPLMAPIATDDEQPNLAENSMPPTRAQFETLSKRLEAVVLETKNGLRYLLWAVIVIGGLLLLMKH